MQKDNKQPLYKVLNEQRTQGYLLSLKMDDKYIIHTLEDKFKFTHHLSIDDTINKDEAKANAQYTALAVNNLAELAEALQGLLSSYKADFKTITGSELNDTEAVKKAKEALNKIS